MVPACAGVIPKEILSGSITKRGSRMCGGDPGTLSDSGTFARWFPHVRG